MFKNKTFIFICVFVISQVYVNAQSLLYKISLEEQIEQASLIIEGKVVDRMSYFSSVNNRIYTINQVKVHRVFKGEQQEYINVVTKGGSVGFKKEEVKPSLQLRKNTIGVFMLVPEMNQFDDFSTSLNTYNTYADLQGFYVYDEYNNTVTNPYYTFLDIQESFYKRLSSITNKNIKLLDYNFPFERAAKNLTTSSINTFTPQTVHSGTGETIVISGSDFGNSMGGVQFRNANNGGDSFDSVYDSAIESWSNTSITVLVPSFAGTGNVRVITENGEFITSGDVLIVTSAELNAEFNTVDLAEQNFRAKLYNSDQQGGYTWTYNEDFFANSDAVAAFERAIYSWRCATNISWLISDKQSTIEGTNDDNMNIVAFKSGTASALDEIDPGILAVTSTYYSGCQNGDTVTSFVSEIDMTFNSDTEWYFGEGLPNTFENDFQGTATHELGHAHSLGHVIAPTNLMHFNTSKGPDSATRIIDDDAIEGALINYEFSKEPGLCGEDSIIDRDCDDESVEDTQEDLVNIENPVGEMLELSIKDTNASEYSFSLFDMNGRVLRYQKLTKLKESLDVSFLDSGLYIVKVIVGNNIEVKKILKI